jgi:hypothetical protein
VKSSGMLGDIMASSFDYSLQGKFLPLRSLCPESALLIPPTAG